MGLTGSHMGMFRFMPSLSRLDKRGREHAIAPAAEAMESSLSVVFFFFTNILLAYGQCTYIVDVYTGDKPGAGTDADVYMRLKSQNGVSLNFQLNRPGNNFEINNVDRFIANNVCAGRICKIEVTQNGRNPSSSWYVKGVNVAVKQGNRCISSESFTINQWVKDPVMEYNGDLKYHWVPANNCDRGALPNPHC